MKSRMNVGREGEIAIVSFEGSGRFGTDDSIRERLFGLASEEKFLVIDLSPLTDIEFEDLGFLVWVRKAHREKWGAHMHQFKVVAPHGDPRRKIEALHMEHILCTYRSLPEALSSVPCRRAVILDPDDDMASVIEVLLETHGYEVVRYRRFEDLPLGDCRGEFDVALTEIVFDGKANPDIVRNLKIALGAPIGVITSAENVKIEGAVFVEKKPVTPATLLKLIKEALDVPIHGYYENLFDFIPLPMIVLDVSGRLVQCNKRWRNTFHVYPSHVDETEVIDFRFAVPDSFPQLKELLQSSLALPTRGSEEDAQLVWTPGSRFAAEAGVAAEAGIDRVSESQPLRRFSFRLNAVPSAGGKYHILVTATEAQPTSAIVDKAVVASAPRKSGRTAVTEETIAGEHDMRDVLFSLLEDVDRARQELAGANERLRELDRLKSEFLSTVSHEFRTPLAAVKGSVENMLDGFLGDVTVKQQRALSVILRNTRRLGRLIENLLDLSRIEAGTFKLRRRRIDLREALRMAIEEIQPVAHKSGIALHCSIPEHEVIVESDADRLAQIVLNLVDNAIRFARHSVTLSIDAEPGGSGDVGILVEDDGPGIPAAQLEHIFERFAFVKAYADKANTGIGLSIVRALVESHGGKVWAENIDGVEGHGARFVVRLPQALDSKAGQASGLSGPPAELGELEPPRRVFVSEAR